LVVGVAVAADVLVGTIFVFVDVVEVEIELACICGTTRALNDPKSKMDATTVLCLR
jgi:hypothetical protein